MNTSDFIFIVQWWVILFAAGLAVLPLTMNIFHSFLDKGYAFSKILGIIFISYIVFILGVIKIVPFSSVTIYSVSILLLAVSYITVQTHWKKVLTRRMVLLFLLEELLFFFGLCIWSYIRGFNPDIFGLEKYMDFGFVNSILRSTYFPPMDMWYPPYPINYYYFGHLITAVLTKASSIPSFITYNLMIATLFALSFIESFSIGITLLARLKNPVLRARKIIIGGVLIASLVTLGGNLHVLYAFFKPYETDKPKPFWELPLALDNPCYGKDSYEKPVADGTFETIYCSNEDKVKISSFPNSYWYPNATRFIHNTIHEFPIYSWVVADLHGHVSDIPIVLLTIAFIFSILISFFDHELDFVKDTKREKSNIFSPLLRLKNYIFLGFLIGVMFMTNAWDGLTYLLLSGCMLLYTQWKRVQQNIDEKTTHNPLLFFVPKHHLKSFQHFFLKNPLRDIFFGVVTYLCIIVISFYIFSKPFTIFFNASQIVSGIGVLNAPSFLLEKKHIDPAQTMYGSDKRPFFSQIVIPDHCRTLMTPEEEKLVTTQYETRKIGPFLFEPDHCLRSPWWQLFVLYGFFYFFVIVLTVFLYRRKKQIPDIFIVLLIITSSVLIITPEFIYMKDIYPDHYRANTMFKLVFQAFIMLSIVSGYTIIRVLSKDLLSKKSLSKTVGGIFFILTTLFLLFMIFMYPYFAVTSYYPGFKDDIDTYICRMLPFLPKDKASWCASRQLKYQGLDGLQYLKKRSIQDENDDYKAILWLNHIKGQPVILESQGDSYTEHERISANTGLPTVLGWFVHEWLWRGEDVPKPRSEDVKKIYESENIDETRDLLKRYTVAYVIIGDLERQKYPNLIQDKFNRLGREVFTQGKTSIYEIY